MDYIRNMIFPPQLESQLPTHEFCNPDLVIGNRGRESNNKVELAWSEANIHLTMLSSKLRSLRLELIKSKIKLRLQKNSIISFVDGFFNICQRRFIKLAHNVFSTEQPNNLKPLELVQEVAQIKGFLTDHERKFDTKTSWMYLTPTEVACISEAITEPLFQDIVTFLEENRWSDFLILLKKTEESPKALSYHLIAAHIQGKISFDVTITTLIALYAYAESPGSVDVTDLDETTLSFCRTNRGSDHLQEIEKSLWLRLAKQVPPNERKIITVKCECFDDYTAKLINSNFFNSEKSKELGVFNISRDGHNYYGIASFSLLRARFFEKGIHLDPIIHLTPNRRELMSRIVDGRSDVVILLPGDQACIHGSRKGLIWGSMHDLIHANEQVSMLSPGKAEDVSLIFNQIQDYLDSYQHDYASKLKLEQVPYPIFIEAPTCDEMCHYILRYLSSALLDRTKTIPYIKDTHSNVFNVDRVAFAKTFMQPIFLKLKRKGIEIPSMEMVFSAPISSKELPSKLPDGIPLMVWNVIKPRNQAL